MGILDFLFGRTPRLTDEPPEFDVTVGNIRLNKDTLDPTLYREIQRQLAMTGCVDLTVTVPIDDDSHTVSPKPETAARYTEPVEPVFCTIDYIDATGNASRRRITTRSVKCAGDRSIIAAVCHERKALRHFRVDRISRVVTFDGEVFDAATFVKDILAVDVSSSARPAREVAGEANDKGQVNFRTYTKPTVLILTALSLVDDHLHPEEAEVILRYIEDEAFALHRAGVISELPDISAFDMIGRRIPRLRPTRDDIADAFRALHSRPRDEIDRLKVAVARVVTADGAVHLAEEQFLADIDTFLAQTDTSAWAELDRMMAMR